MIKVTSEISTNDEKEIVSINTRVLVGVEKEVCKDCWNQIIKSELKALLMSLVEHQPDLLFDAMEEVLQEGLRKND